MIDENVTEGTTARLKTRSGRVIEGTVVKKHDIGYTIRKRNGVEDSVLITHIRELKPITFCSFCSVEALYVGEGQDGDFYCFGHRKLAPGGITNITYNN